MDPLAPLIEEHRQIRSVIVAVSGMLDRARTQPRLSPLAFLELQHFIQRFADGTHHAKEEQVLFRKLIEAGLPPDSGPLGCMTREHVQGRRYAEVIGDAARACLEGDWTRQPELIEAARAWCALLSAHIEKEDLVLYPLAMGVLDAASLAALPSAFRAVDPLPPFHFKEAAFKVIEASATPPQARAAG